MSTRPRKHADAPPPLAAGGKPGGEGSVLYCWTCGRVISPRKSHGKNPLTPPRYCSSRCRSHRPNDLCRHIEATFVSLLTDDPSKPPTPSSHSHPYPRPRPLKGDSRRLILCSEVERYVFAHAPDPARTYGRQKNRPKRGVPDEGEWRSVDMEERSAGSHTRYSESHSPNEDEGDDGEDDSSEVAGVPIRLPSSHTSTQTPDLTAVCPTNQPTPPQPTSPPPPAHDLSARRAGQQRAEERELVRQAARRGVAFGFLVVGGGSGSAGAEERRRCEAVQGGRVVEASFAKGEWGVRWRA
ncbi:hypothetical protein MMC34_003348 [Xylographa carneopallida]|nr:hypothetical protein [Xylographa carneopallida]